MKRSITIIFNTALLLSLIAGAGAAQSPYNLNFGREALVIGAGGASLVGGVLLKDQTEALLSLLAELKQGTIDRILEMSDEELALKVMRGELKLPGQE